MLAMPVVQESEELTNEQVATLTERIGNLIATVGDLKQSLAEDRRQDREAFHQHEIAIEKRWADHEKETAKELERTNARLVILERRWAVFLTIMSIVVVTSGIAATWIGVFR